MAMRTVAVFLGVLGKSAASSNYFATDADPFLGKVVASRAFVRAEIETALRNASLRNVGHEEDKLEQRLDALLGQLRPVYSVLPKNTYARLGSAGVRYLLHRHFLRRHAWRVHGLAPSGGSWSAPFPMRTLAVWAPAELQKIVADHLNGRGMRLREVAVLALMLENRVHAEAVDILQAIWRAHDLRPDEKISASLMATIVAEHARYHIAYSSGTDDSKLKALSLEKLAQAWDDTVYPGWPSTQKLLTEFQKSVTRGAEAEFGFAVGEQIVMRFIRGFGVSQDEECQNLKRDLVKLESSREGRVDLRRFHAAATNQQGVGFIETADYLRQIGALDESTGSQDVIIPNYINGPSNTLFSGRHFSVACLDECEDLLGHVERRVGGPVATVSELLSIVRSLPPKGHVEPRALDDALVRHLHEVAELHAGVVPLHGRLFALWMHHAYPRDCPYPSIAGTTMPLLPEEYEAQTHLPPKVSDAELALAAQELAARPLLAQSDAAPLALPWDLEEDAFERKEGVDFEDALPILVAGAFSCILLLGSLVVAKCRSKRGAVDPSRLLDVDGTGPQGASEPSEAAS